MSDTPPDVEARYRELLLARSPGERLRMGADMFTTARELCLAALRAQGETDLRVGLFLRFYGAEFPPEQRDAIVERLRALDRRQPLSLGSDAQTATGAPSPDGGP